MILMGAILPVLSFLVLWLGCYRQISKWRQSFVYSVVLWGMAVFSITEIASFFHAFSFFPLFFAWLLVFLAGSLWLYSSRGLFNSTLFIQRALSLSLTEKFLWTVLIVIASIKGYSALMSAPNTYDSMTYHLARIEHWIQNGSLAHYPTATTRQIYTPSLAEQIILHFKVLSGSDYFSNVVQWFAAITSWITVSLLAQKLSADSKGQMLASVLAATLPMGLVQQTSTQTDYVLTCWFSIFVYLLWDLFQVGGYKRVLLTGASLGLACLTKGNAHVFSIIWILIYAAASFRLRDSKKLKNLAMVLLIAFVLNLPYGLRNVQTFGSAYWTHEPMTNQSFSISTLGINVMRNTALHLGTPWEQVNQGIKNAISSVCKIIDPHSQDLNIVIAYSMGEDDLGNCLYLVLFILALVILGWHRCFKNRLLGIYAFGTVATFVIFCFIVHYDVFNSRFHLAMFVLSCALTATVGGLFLRKYAIILVMLPIGLSLPWLLTPNEHSFFGQNSILKVPRLEQYFSERRDLILPFNAVSEIIQSQNCKDIGLIQEENSWEYPWWVLFSRKYGKDFRMEHVLVNNPTAKLNYPRGTFTPCALIASEDQRTSITLPQGKYVRVWYAALPKALTSVFLKVP